MKIESTLAIDQAYDAMPDFLSKMHNEFGWKQLGALLGSMELIDGVPMDLALVKDWNESMESTLRAGSYEANDSRWTKDQAYLAMLHFLQQLFDAKRDDIGSLIHDMTRVNGKPRDNTLITLWKRAAEFVDGGGKPDPYVLVKDGIPYEVHRGTPAPKKD